MTSDRHQSTPTKAGLDKPVAPEDRPDRPGPEDTGRSKVAAPRSISDGLAVISSHLKTLPSLPGVYRMLDAKGDALYVGKAGNLKKRVTSYTQAGRQPARLLRMIAETCSMEFVVVGSEVEALLLEANLIKRLRPRYNVLLRDDKTFPHILLTGDHPYPQITKHRGAENRKGKYFGPFASAGAVNRTITSLQRAFLLRNCADTVFSVRNRPCLQYQIKRCTAPCVGLVSEQEYAEQVSQAVDFLSGKSRSVADQFVAKMNEASEALDYETAARFRDRVRALTAVQAQQDINVEGIVEADAFAVYQEGGQTCVQVYFVRAGRNYGTRAFFPSHEKGLDPAKLMTAFLGQFYENKIPAKTLLLSGTPAEQELLAEALSVRADKRVEILVPSRGAKRRLVDHAQANAREALARRLAESSSQRRLLSSVGEVFGLDGPPQRIEVYDNSHISGTSAIGAMIVAGPEGFIKNAYRKFNIKQAEAAGDDFAMMREVLSRRFSRALREDPDRQSPDHWPDLVLIDGGKGQLSAVQEVLGDLGIDDLPLVSIAKGPDRNAGRETFYLAERDPFQLEPTDPVLYYLQRLRDEAHRFAISTHRAKRSSSIGRSAIDDIAGIGPRRKKALLNHFGSARAVGAAGLADLERVEGISQSVAKKIYDHFRQRG